MPVFYKIGMIFMPIDSCYLWYIEGDGDFGQSRIYFQLSSLFGRRVLDLSSIFKN